MDNRDFKVGDLVKRRKYTDRFGNNNESFDIGVIIEFRQSERLSVSPRALVLVRNQVVDTATFFLDLI